MKKLLKLLCMIGWHSSPEEVTVEGINFKGVCPHCEKRVMMDSQFGWFTY